MMRVMRDMKLIMESGATKTDCCLLDGAGEICSRFTVSGINVAVTSPGGVARLSPNEAAVYSRSVRRLSTIRTKKTNPEIAWRQGDFVFDNEPLREIARKLSHAFDTPIIIQDDSLADYRIRARFSSQETLDEMLSLLKETVFFSYERTGNQIIIQAKQE